MIIRCQNGRLLNSDHVVEWDTKTTGEGDEERHTVTAQTVLDIPRAVFEGAQDECERRLDEIYASLSEESTMLRHLCDGLARRDDKLAATVKRFIRTTS